MDTTVADPLLGTLIDGRYRIRGRVARGGMATVYTAVDERLERTVALKIIHSSRSGDRQFLDRFADEAKTIARLTHPNVVAVYDQGTHGTLPYLVMEYVQGRTLRDLLAQRRRLTPVEALAILEQMLAAIAAAHRAGLVHRDVKPENVLVAQAPSGGPANLVDSVVKVADFGLARAVEASTDGGTGQLMATVAYVAPELVTQGHADARTDVYSAGIVLFEMLTGRVPYDGDRPVEVAWQHVDNDVPSPSTIVPGLPPVLDDLVIRATRRDPGARPTDAGALLAEVQTVRDDLGAANVETAVFRQVNRPPAGAHATTVIPTVHTGAGKRPSWARLPDQGRTGHRHADDETAGGLRSRWVALVAAAVIVLVLAGGGWYVFVGRYTDAPRLLNMPKAQAEQLAEEAGFPLSYDTPRHDENVPKDNVLTQKPGPDERVVNGERIALTLSLGPEVHQVPDVTGYELAVAKTRLEQEKLVLKEGEQKYSDDLPKGVVLAVNPKPGTQVKAGETVTVVVSKGKAPISVPDVVGKHIDQARAELQAQKLTVLEQQKDSDKPAGEVLSQTPKAGAGVEKGAEVKLEISKGPPFVVVPRVIDLPCQTAKSVLEGKGLRVKIELFDTATTRNQNPGENTQVPSGSEVILQCYF